MLKLSYSIRLRKKNVNVMHESLFRISIFKIPLQSQA